MSLTVVQNLTLPNSTVELVESDRVFAEPKRSFNDHERVSEPGRVSRHYRCAKGVRRSPLSMRRVVCNYRVLGVESELERDGGGNYFIKLIYLLR